MGHKPKVVTLLGRVRLIGYCRVSRVAGRGGDSFISPKVQKDRCKGVAAAGGHKITKWIEDLDQSGAKADRPGFQEALRLIEMGKSDGIVVAKLDRFSRSVADAAEALKRIDKAGGAFLSAEDSLDTSTPMGRFALHMMLAIAELEWERRREGWSVARENAVSRGIHVASRTPTGYVKGDDGRLVPSEWAPRITEAFKAKANGASWTEISRRMEGIPTPYGSTHWTNRSMSHLLTNRVYLGEARSGEFVLADAHPPLIDEGTFQLAQRSPQRASVNTIGDFLLTGMLRCAGCRYSMKPDSMAPKHGPQAGVRIRSYRCRGERAMGKCSAQCSTLARVIEPYVEDLFLDRMRKVATTTSLDTSARDTAIDARDEARAQRDAFLGLTIADPVVAQTELNRRQEILDVAEAHLASLDTGPVLDGAQLVEVWDDLDTSEKKGLMLLGIDTIFLRRAPSQGMWPIDGRVRILWRGEGPSGLPGPGRRNVPLRAFTW